mgnify:CR=1 FL=1
MKQLIKTFTFIIIVLNISVASSNIQVYKFDDPKKEQRFNLLVQELRCPKCQNNNLADSNSELAVDLKQIVYEKVLSGETNQEITDYLKARYGDFISYRPPLNPSTWFIWFGPFVFLAIGGLFVFRFIASRKISVRSSANENIVEVDVSNMSKSLLSQWAEEADTGRKASDINNKVKEGK